MNPENLSRVTEISCELRDIDSDIEFLEDFYENSQYTAKIDFDFNGKFYRLYLEKADIKAIIRNRWSKRENLMAELEKL